MMVELADRYVLNSNQERGFGRYDVMLEPKREGRAADNRDLDAIIIEYKVQDTDEEQELTDTVEEALAQIERQRYDEALEAKGIPGGRIRKYGFAFAGRGC